MVDAVVVGAGPAGVLAALALARTQARVLVLDRTSGVVDDGVATLQPDTVRFLAAAGVLVPAEARSTLPTWRVTWATGASAVLEAPAIVIGWRPLLESLRSAAAGAGARFEWGWHVRRLLTDDTGAVRGLMMARRGTEPVRIPTPLVVVADGWRSRLAHHRSDTLRRASCWTVCEQLVTGIGAAGACGEMHLGRSAYLELTPAGDTTTHVRLVYAGVGRAGPSVVDAIRERFPDGADRFGGARVAGRRHVARFSHRPMAAYAAGVLAAGAAAGRHDPRGVVDLRFALADGWRAGTEAGRLAEAGDLARAVGPGRTASGGRAGRSGAFTAWSVLAGPALMAALGAGAWFTPRRAASLWAHGLQPRGASLPAVDDRGESEAMMG